MGLRRCKRLLRGCFAHLGKAKSQQFHRSSMRKLIAILAFSCISHACSPWNGTGIDDVDDYFFRDGDDNIEGDILYFMLPHRGSLWTATSVNGPWKEQ